MIVKEEKGLRGSEKDAHLKTPSLVCWVSPRFQPKNSQKRPRVPGPRIHSIHPYMEFQKSTDINMDILDFWILVFYEYFRFLDISLRLLVLSIQVWIFTLISKQGYPCKDILQ